jgi:hypothetical protein
MQATRVSVCAASSAFKPKDSDHWRCELRAVFNTVRYVVKTGVSRREGVEQSTSVAGVLRMRICFEKMAEYLRGLMRGRCRWHPPSPPQGPATMEASEGRPQGASSGGSAGISCSRCTSNRRMRLCAGRNTRPTVQSITRPKLDRWSRNGQP